MEEKQKVNKLKVIKPPRSNKSIRLYKWGDIVKCDYKCANCGYISKTYWTALGYLKMLVFGKRHFCYLTEWYSEEQRKAYLEKREAEFKERVKQSLTQKLKG